jgi:drug/metabolite transporter (DMT)-like permease
VWLDHWARICERHCADGDDVFRWFVAIDHGTVRSDPTPAQLARTASALEAALVLLGVTGVSTHTALAYLGLRYTTATNGVILNSFIPIMIITLS